MHLGNPHFSLWEIAQEIFVAIVVTFKNLFTLGTCFQVFYSISILWLHMASNAQSLVNYLEKIIMATNSSGLTWIQPICQEQRERERRERQRARINRWRASANFMQHLVTEFCVILLCFNGLFALELQNEIQLLSIKIFLLSLAGFLLDFGWEMCCLTKSSCKSLLSKKYNISILTLPAHTASLALGKIQKLLAGQTGDFGKWIKIRFLQKFLLKAHYYRACHIL